MLNTVFQAIEKFETSNEYENVPLPTPIFDNGNGNETISLLDTDEESSDYSEELSEDKDAAELLVKYQTNQAALKQTLKDKIRIRRESEGAGEITTLFEAPRTYELTPDEERKNEVRKARNRCSATRSRLKRIAREKQLEQDAVTLEKEHEQMKREVNVLKRLKLLLTTTIQGHLAKCQKQATKECTAISSNLSKTNSFGIEGNIAGTTSISTTQRAPPLSLFTGATQLIGEPQVTQCQTPIPCTPMKRKVDENQSMQPFKIRPTWNPEKTPTGSFTEGGPRFGTSTQTSANNAFSEAWTNTLPTTTSPFETISGTQSVSMTTVSPQYNAISAIPHCNMSMDHSFSYSEEHPIRSQGIPTAQSATLLDGKGRNDPWLDQILKSDVTEQQKIDHIKQHLLDGFETQPQQCDVTT